jgi:ribosomal protein L11 methyltransferase
VRWIEISAQCHPEAVESVSELLSEIAAGGVAIEEPYDLEDDGQRYRHIPGALVTLRAYIPEDDEAAPKQARLATALWHLKSLGDHFIGDLTTRTVDDEDWAEAWKAHFHVTRIGRRTVICPTWREYTPESPDDIIIAIDPGMAFGTGTHPTTRMCLEALEDVTHTGDDVLDVGTGSGILTIAALRLGAARALAIDISTVAVRTTQENIALNGLTGQVAVTQGTLGIGPDGEPLLTPAAPELGEDPLALLGAVRAITPARLVVANIIARVIGALAPALYAATAPGGTLVASGIIQDRRHEAQDPLIAAGFTITRVLQEDDWLTLIARRDA